MAAIADNQLFSFMEGNKRRLAAGKKPDLLLDTGEKVTAVNSILAGSNVCHQRSAWPHTGRAGALGLVTTPHSFCNKPFHSVTGVSALQRVAIGCCCLGAGLWRYSRHPNYFFEQLFWWSLALFGANVGAPWVFFGPLFNSACMVQVTRLTEERMLRRPERAALYRKYMRCTSVWVPMPATRSRA